jgi:hypothetical protein
MELQFKLLKAIKESPERYQKKVAEKAKIQPSLLSMAINGRYILNSNQKRSIAKVLNRTVEELFIQ